MRTSLWFVTLLLLSLGFSTLQASGKIIEKEVEKEVGKVEGGMHPIAGISKGLIDPEFIGIEKEEKVRVFIATENLRGLAEELRKVGINVSFGRTITYSKLIMPLIEVKPEQVPMLSKLSNALFVGKYPDIESLKAEKGLLAAEPSIAGAYTGQNTTILLLTDGIEFGLPGLENSYALWPEDSDYAGYPDVFDFASIYDYLEDGECSNESWFVDTSWNASGYVENGSVYIDYMGKKFNVTGIPSLSSTFHIGLMPPLPGRERCAVLVTDSRELWKYDSVYVDLNNDLSFGDERAIDREHPIYARDLNGDGKPDISTGLLYWISDGIHTLPHSRFVAERFGFENIVPQAGSLLCFFGDYLNSSGSQIAQAIIKSAPKTKILPVVVRNQTNIFEAWVFCAYGNDYLPNSGDEKDVCLSTFLLRCKRNYWSYIDRYFTYLLSSTKVIFVLPALENPENFSPLSSYALYAGTYNMQENLTAAQAEQIATFLAGSKIALLPSFAQASYAWNMREEVYAGPALSAALSAGLVAKILEIFKGSGIPIRAEAVREIVASATENTLLDALSQGRGILNQTQAIQIATGSQGLRTSGLSLEFGDYEGVEYPAFPKFVFPNTTYKEEITLLSLNTDVELSIQAKVLKRISNTSLTFTLAQNATGFLSLSQMLDRNASVCRVSISASDGQGNRGDFWIEFYVWLDLNENLIEDPGEIVPIYITKMLSGLGSFSFSISNWSHLEGAFLHFIPLQENPELNVEVCLNWFNYTDFPWIEQTSLFLPANFPYTLENQLNVPSNASIGCYEGKLLLLGSSINKGIGFKINVMGELDREYEIYGGFYGGDLSPGLGSALTQKYYFYVPLEASQLWKNVVLEINLTKNASIEHSFLYPDTFSIIARKTFGPGALISTKAVGEHLANLRARDTLILPLMPGLNEIRLSSPKLLSPISPSSIKIYTLNLSGDTQVEGVFWQEKFEFIGRCSAPLNLSASALGLALAQELNLSIEENNSANIQIILNQSNPFICLTTNSWLSIWKEGRLVAYSIEGKVYIPYLEEGIYTIEVFSMEKNASITFVNISGNTVSTQVFPGGEIEPNTDFFIGAYLPKPSKPGIYFACLSLQLQRDATPYFFPFSERIIDLPPYFIELWPSNGSVLKEVRVHGRYADSEGSLKTEVVEVYLYLNGANYSQFCVFNSTEFSLPILLGEGNYRALIEIKDANGMGSSAEISFTVDRTAPFLQILSPHNYFITKEPLLFLVCQSEAEATVYVNGEIAQSEEPGIFFSTTALREGWNVIEVKAVDRAGNYALQVLYVYLDTTPPQIYITWPQNGHITRSAFITVSGLTEGNAFVSVNGVSTYADNAGKFSVGLTLSQDGENLIEVLARDLAGNENKYGIVVVLDRTPPDIALDEVEPITCERVITISGMVRDANPEPYVIVNSIRGELKGGRFSLTLVLSEGANQIRVTALDKAGNSNTKFLTVTLDTTPPALNLSLPKTVTKPRIKISGTTEPGAKLFINNLSVYVSPNGSFACEINLTKGLNFITVNVSDAIGNTRTLTFALLYVDPNELNVDDIYRYNTLSQKLTELMDSLVFAVLLLVVILVVALIGLYKYILWRFRKEKKSESLKEIFEEEKK